MKKIYLIISAIIVLGVLVYGSSNYQSKRSGTKGESPVTVTPISHATMVLHWSDKVIYTDPTGGVEAFRGQPAANLILITDIHGDHLSTSTLSAVVGNAILIVPKAVKDLLPESLASRAYVLGNGDIMNTEGFEILAMPMYNLPESADNRHAKGRGNGYVIQKDGYHVYIAGDTAGIPEMRALKDIDMAFVPMNLPYTMGIDEAASAVLDFKPKVVYPYHYRGSDGLADINKFKDLVNTGNPDIQVELQNWYPQK